MKTKWYAVILLVILWNAGIAQAKSKPAALAAIEIPEYSTTVPAAKILDNGNTNKYFITNHNAHLARKKELGNDVEILFVGDSITHGFIRETTWGEMKPKGGLGVWRKYYEPRKALCAGIGGDRTEHVLWRLKNGLLDGIQPKVAILTIGHNNGKSPMEEIGWGMVAIMRQIRMSCPSTKIIFIPHFPTRNKEWQMSKMQQAYTFALETVSSDKRILALDLSEFFMDVQGLLNKELVPDGTHPGIKGYEAWQKGMEPTLLKLLAQSR